MSFQSVAFVSCRGGGFTWTSFIHAKTDVSSRVDDVICYLWSITLLWWLARSRSSFVWVDIPFHYISVHLHGCWIVILPLLLSSSSYARVRPGTHILVHVLAASEDSWMNFIDCDSLKRTLIPANFMNIYGMPWFRGREEWWKGIYLEKTKPPTQFAYHGIGYYYKGCDAG